MGVNWTILLMKKIFSDQSNYEADISNHFIYWKSFRIFALYCKSIQNNNGFKISRNLGLENVACIFVKDVVFVKKLEAKLVHYLHNKISKIWSTYTVTYSVAKENVDFFILWIVPKKSTFSFATLYKIEGVLLLIYKLRYCVCPLLLHNFVVTQLLLHF